MATQDTLEASNTNNDKLIILLEKLHLDTFDDISDQIIAIMNFNASTTNTTWASAAGAVAQLIGNVLERVTDDVTRSETYACLCRKLIDNISPEIQDEIILTTEGRPIAGGQLFRKYLFWRLQEGVELGWLSEDRQGVKNLSDGTAITPTDDTFATASNVDEQERGTTVELDSIKSHTLQKTKRQALDLITFAGELFVLQILAERPMHDFIRRLLNNAGSDTEDEFETLFKLLTTVGKLLETARGSPYMDVYISRMRSLADDPSTSARSKAILLDLIELRNRQWTPQNAAAQPTAIEAAQDELRSRLLNRQNTVAQPTAIEAAHADVLDSRTPTIFGRSSVTMH